jgi:hypothetical protein
MSKKKSSNPKSVNFDWLLFLNKPVEEVKQIDVERANRLSGDWPTCACGQLCQLLPRGEGNEPEDNVLYDLGIQFDSIMAQYDDATFAYHSSISLGKTSQQVYNKRVANGKRKKALAIFNKIEKRTIKLLSQLNEQNIVSK